MDPVAMTGGAAKIAKMLYITRVTTCYGRYSYIVKYVKWLINQDVKFGGLTLYQMSTFGFLGL